MLFHHFPFSPARLCTYCCSSFAFQQMRGPPPSCQPEHSDGITQLNYYLSAPPSTPFPKSRMEKQTAVSNSSLLHQKTENIVTRPPAFFFFFPPPNKQRKSTYHLRRLTVLTIFQPFWHKFFWNCLKTSATLVALFKCTSSESFRRSEAWTFTTLEGWTRKAEEKRIKHFKKDFVIS